MNDLQDVADFLPDSVKELVEIIGFSATEKLVRGFGGSSLKFARTDTRYFNKLAEVVGNETAEQILDYFGGGEFYVPRCDRALKILRNRRFYEAFCRLKAEQHLSGRMAMVQLCPEFQISWRLGWEIVARYQRSPTTAQASLF